MIVGWGEGNEDQFTYCMYVFCRGSQFSSTHFKSIPSFPGHQNRPCLGASSKGRTFVGSFTSGKNEYSWTTYQFYEFVKGKRCWRRLAPTNLQRQGAASCLISKDVLMVAGGVQQVSENIKYKSIEILKSKKDSFRFLPPPRWKCYYSCQPQASLQWHTITVIDNDKVIVIGGLPENRISTNRVYMGYIEKRRCKISWKELKPLNFARHDHFAFKMGRHIVVGGGDQNSKYTGANYVLSCEIYDLDTGNWKITSHYLPFPMLKASVAVESHQNFAIITGGKHGTLSNDRFIMLPGMRNKMLIYTKDKGFVEYHSSSVSILSGPHVAVDFN